MLPDATYVAGFDPVGNQVFSSKVFRIYYFSGDIWKQSLHVYSQHTIFVKGLQAFPVRCAGAAVQGGLLTARASLAAAAAD
jgi:hypothetical protein